MKKISLIFLGALILGALVFIRLDPVKKTPAWMTEQIHEDLSPFAKEDLNPVRIRSSFENLPSKLFLAHIVIKDNQVYWEQNGWSDPVPSARVEKLCKMLFNLSRRVELPNSSFLITLHDGLTGSPSSMGVSEYLPIMTFAKNKQATHGVLIPDVLSKKFIFKNCKPFSSFNLERLKKHNWWSQKIEKAFWRGGTTGGTYLSDNWHEKPRTHLVLLSQYYPEKVDAGFSTFPQISDEVKAEMLKVVPQSNWVNSGGHLKYKYLIVSDGNTCTYPRLMLALYSGSVVFKDESEDYQWFYRLLKPNKHYIPVKRDFSNLPEKVDWAITHDSEAKKIAKASRKLVAKELNAKRIEEYVITLLTHYSNIQDSSFEVPSSMHHYKRGGGR